MTRYIHSWIYTQQNAYSPKDMYKMFTVVHLIIPNLETPQRARPTAWINESAHIIHITER